MPQFAEDSSFFDTTVSPGKSQAEVIELLENFGATNYQLSQGQADGRTTWLVRFEWQGRAYRFLFVPLSCRAPTHERSFGGRRRTYAEQARYQMGRIALNFVKAILNAASMNPDALFGFLELPGIASRTPAGCPPQRQS